MSGRAPWWVRLLVAAVVLVALGWLAAAWRDYCLAGDVLACVWW